MAAGHWRKAIRDSVLGCDVLSQGFGELGIARNGELWNKGFVQSAHDAALAARSDK
jgi:hypothetical protein